MSLFSKISGTLRANPHIALLWVFIYVAVAFFVGLFMNALQIIFDIVDFLGGFIPGIGSLTNTITDILFTVKDLIAYQPVILIPTVLAIIVFIIFYVVSSLRRRVPGITRFFDRIHRHLLFLIVFCTFAAPFIFIYPLVYIATKLTKQDPW